MSRTPTPARCRTDYEPPTSVAPMVALAALPFVVVVALSSPAAALVVGLVAGVGVGRAAGA